MAVLLESKSCNRCGETKTLDQFYKESRRPDGLYPNCKECHKTYTNAWRNSEKGKQYVRTLKFEKYGISGEDYDRMLADQQGVCAICKSDDSSHNGTNALLIDHDHVTGAVRGLLCVRCNFGLGYFRDRSDLLQAADQYLAQGS